MARQRSAPNDAEFKALAALAGDNMDFFQSRAVRLTNTYDNKINLLLLSPSLEPVAVVDVVVEDTLVESFLPLFEKDSIVHKVVDIVGVYLSKEDQQLFKGQVSVVAVRRSTSLLSATTLQAFLRD